MEPGIGIRFLIFCLVLLTGSIFTFGAHNIAGELATYSVGVLTVVLAGLLAASVFLANEWQRAIVLRLGRFNRVDGPGIFFVWPIIESVNSIVDTRTVTTSISAEQAITVDTVPVDINAVLFWRVLLPERAALIVEDYNEAVFRAAQTALRDIIGRSSLATLLGQPDKVDETLKSVIDSRTEPWGIQVEAVKIKDARIPPELQSAMSREAQAQRERQARVILGNTELEIAHKFTEAAKVYSSTPNAMHLRALTILAEGMKEKGSLMIIPSSALDSMNLGTIVGAGLSSTQAFVPEIVSKGEEDDHRENKIQVGSH